MTLIQTEPKKIYIRVDEQWWQPWVNTVFYYPLESDGNDYSWNSHNLTWYWTPTYTTSWWTKQVVSLNGSTGGIINNLSGTYTNYTFNLWCKPTSTNTWQEIFDNVYIWNSNNAYLNYNWTSYEKWWYRDFAYQYRPNGWTNAYQNVYWTSNRTTSMWYNVVLTSTSSWIKIYVNGSQIATNSTTWTIILNSWYNSIWMRYNNTITPAWYQNFFNWYLSEFIFESTTRTAQEVSDYYNDTKSLYWIS